MSVTVGIVGGNGKQLAELVRGAGMKPVLLKSEQLESPHGPFIPPDALLLDVREDRRPLSSVAAMKRRFPTMGVAVVAASLDPELMLEAMRAGVTECVAEPITQHSVESAINRVGVLRSSPDEGKVLAVVGAKGGVGATTLAVNVAEAFAQRGGSALLLDLHAANGDASVFLGVEPRFGMVEALENAHRLDAALFKDLVMHTKSGLDLLASPARISSGQFDAKRVQGLLDFAIRHYPAIVLDVPWMDGAILNALDATAAIFVVVNHELPTIRSGFRLVAALRQRYGEERIQVLVNRSDPHSDISLKDIQKAVDAKIAHTFPSDYKLALAAVNKGEPFAQSSQGKLPASIHAFVKVLTGQPKELASEESNRLFGWLTPRRSH